MKSSNTYVTVASYFNDMKIIDDRLSKLEHIIDNITKYQVEMLNMENKDDGNTNTQIRPQ